MSDATIDIELRKDIFAQLKMLRQDLGAIKDSVTKTEEASKTSFGKISGYLKQINFVQINQGLQQLNQSFTSINAPGLKFGSALAEVSAITGVTGKALADLGEKARTSALEFGGTAAESLDTYKVILSRLGPEIANNQEALSKMEKNARILSKTMGGDMVAATDALTTAMLQYGIDLSDPMKAQEEMDKMMNVMAAGSKEGAAEVTSVAAALKVAGVQMKQSKVSFEEGNAAIQALAKGGKEGAESGVALRNILGKIAGEDIIPKEALGKLKSLGVDMSIVSNTSLPLIDRLNELKKAQADATLITQVFGVENAAAANILLDNIAFQDELTDKITGTNTAYEQAAIVMESTEEKQKRMNARIEDAKLAFFEATGGLTAYLQPLAEVGQTLAGFAPLISLTVKGFKSLYNSKIAQIAITKTLNLVMKANPVLMITGLVVGLTASIYTLIKANKSLTLSEKVSLDLKSRTVEKSKAQRAEVELLFAKLKMTKSGTDEYNSVLRDLDSILPGITEKYNLQSGALADINAAYRESIALIEERAKMEAAEEMIKETYEREFELNAKLKTADAYSANSIYDALAHQQNKRNEIFNQIAPEGSTPLKTDLQGYGILNPESNNQLFSQSEMNSQKVFDPTVSPNYIKPEEDVTSKPLKTKINKITNSVNGIDSGNGSGGSKSYSGSENQMKRIDVRIENLVKELTISTTNINEGVAKAKQMVTEALVGAVRDFEVAM